MSAFLFLLTLLSPSAFASGSWYDEVGEARGILKVQATRAGFTPDASAMMPASSSCELSVLQMIGWQITRSEGSNQVLYTPGDPCGSTSLDDVHASGGLTIQVPNAIDEATLQGALLPILGSEASLCGYKYRVRASAAAAANGFDNNQGFQFYGDGWPYIAFTRPEYWTGACVSGSGPSCFFPQVANHVAIGEFSHGSALSVP